MLTPMDIDRKEFKKSLRGYNTEEVENFLMEINKSYEELYLAHQEAKEQIALLSDAVAQYKSMEETLENALAVARKDGEDMKKAARDEADALLREARAEAEEEMSKLSYRWEQMKHGVEVYRAKVVSLLHAQLDIIKEYGEAAPEHLPKAEPEVAAWDGTEGDAMEDTAAIEIPPEEQNTMEIPVIPEDFLGKEE